MAIGKPRDLKKTDNRRPSEHRARRVGQPRAPIASGPIVTTDASGACCGRLT